MPGALQEVKVSFLQNINLVPANFCTNHKSVKVLLVTPVGGKWVSFFMLFLLFTMCYNYATPSSSTLLSRKGKTGGCSLPAQPPAAARTHRGGSGERREIHRNRAWGL